MGGGARRGDDVLLAKVEVPGPVATPDPLHGADLFTKIIIAHTGTGTMELNLKG